MADQITEASLKLGGDWATKEGSLLGFNDQNGNYKPIPFDFTRATTATRVNRDGLIEEVQAGVPRIDFLNNPDGALLLEPQRTNSVAYSEQLDDSYWSKYRTSVIANATTSPDGFDSADEIIDDNTTNTHIVGRPFSFTSGTIYTASIFAKYNGRNLQLAAGNTATWAAQSIFDLQNGVVYNTTQGSAKIENYGNGWYRCSITGTAGASASTNINIQLLNGFTGTYLGDGSTGSYFWGAQLEEGSYATSYIKTSGSAVTRNADYNTASFSNIQSEGTLFAEVEVVYTGDFGTPMALSIDNATTNFILIYKTNINKLSARIRTGGVDQCLIDSGTLTEGYHKFAFKYKNNDCEFFVDGVSVGTDTSASIPTGLNVIRQYIGSSINPFVGGTKQLSYFPTALTNAECIELTTL